MKIDTFLSSSTAKSSLLDLPSNVKLRPSLRAGDGEEGQTWEHSASRQLYVHTSTISHPLLDAASTRSGSARGQISALALGTGVLVISAEYELMEAHVDVEALRRKANALLQDLLQQAAGRSHEETADAITELAFHHANPLKDFFAAASATDGTKLPSPKGTLKSRSSKSLLRFGRSNKRASSESKAAGPVPVGEDDFGDSGAGRHATKGAPAGIGHSATPRTNKGSAFSPYQCIVCSEFLSSKGVCKRHLEDQHVSPKMYKCEKCAEIFALKAKAKEHVKACGKGVFFYVVIKQEEKRIYACEFTGALFPSMPRYLDHLLNLSEKIGDRPTGDLHRKLYALLDQPPMRPFVTEISSRILWSRDAWRSVQWSTASLTKAIEKLEYAIVHDDGTLECSKHLTNHQRTEDVQTYLYSLLCAGSARPKSQHTVRSGSEAKIDALSRISSGSLDSISTVIAKAPQKPAPLSPNMEEPSHTDLNMPQDVVPHVAPVVPVSHPDVAALQTFVDAKGKRHLSDHSRFFVPDRHPPGPPMPPPMPTSVPQMYELIAQSSGQVTPMTASTTSLPFRSQDTHLHNQPHEMDLASRHLHTPSFGTSISSHTGTDSTIMSSYQERELVTPTSFDFKFWPGEKYTLPYSMPIQHQQAYQITQPEYYCPPTSPARPSIATDQIYVTDYNAPEQKPFLPSNPDRPLLPTDQIYATNFSGPDQKAYNFGPGIIDHPAQYGTSFLLDDDDPDDVEILR